MTDPPQTPGPRPPAERLAHLAAELTALSELANQQRHEELAERLAALNDELQSVSRMDPADLTAEADRVRQVANLFGHLQLQLAQQHKETSEQLAKYRKGRTGLSAYGRK